MPIPIIASDMTITITSIVSHVGMRVAGWVIACASAAHVMYRMAAIGCERVHTSWRAKSERRPLCEFAHCLGGAAFSGDRGDERAAFFRGEELCLVRPIREDEKCDYSDPHGWDRFGDVHDLPTPQTELAIQAEKSRRYRRADRHPRSSEKRIGALSLHGSRAKCYTIFNINTGAVSLPL
jgi:hypothetical protein